MREDETTYPIHGRNFLHPWSLGGAEGPLPRVYSRREQPPTLARYYPAVPDMGAPPLPDALIHASREAHGLGPCEAAMVVLEAPVAGGFAAYLSCPINERLELPFVRDATSWPRSQLHCPGEDGGHA